jgi:hypothetical protein
LGGLWEVLFSLISLLFLFPCLHHFFSPRLSPKCPGSISEGGEYKSTFNSCRVLEDTTYDTTFPNGTSVRVWLKHIDRASIFFYLTCQRPLSKMSDSEEKEARKKTSLLLQINKWTNNLSKVLHVSKETDFQLHGFFFLSSRKKELICLFLCKQSDVFLELISISIYFS